ncbi:MAG: hypothetical protein H0W62_14030 [Chitinophagales bacterium]|nr:hypothetical protein [Chitinophagales bacterium]
MVFEFRAHKPSAYYWFAIDLLLLVAVNATVLYCIKPFLHNINQSVSKSIILVVPWIFLLFFPSIAGAIMIYRSFIKQFRFTFSNNNLIVERVKRNSFSSDQKIFLWNEILGYRSSDFEDNHYFILLFREKKNNLILHRDSGNFENFFSELKRYIVL